MRLLNLLLTLILLPILSLANETKISTEGLAIINGCSGGVVRFSGQSLQSRALVATNGHCLLLNPNLNRLFPFPLPGEILRNITEANFLNKTDLKVHGLKLTTNFRPRQLIFGTMSGTDIALFELNESYNELKTRYGIPHFAVSEKSPEQNEVISIRSGLYSRQYTCRYLGERTLIEGPFFTSPAQAFSNECDIYPGYSGSLIFSERTNQVIGLANTHSTHGGELCSFNNPCSYTRSNRKISAPFKGQSYGVSLNRNVLTKPVENFKIFAPDLALTEAEMQKRLARFEKFASPLLQARNVRLVYFLDKDWSGNLGSAGFDKNVLEISFGAALYENPEMTGDTLDLVLCHELGHFMGEAPKKKNAMNASGDWASGEGESDYFAGQCLVKLWSQELHSNLIFKTWTTEARCQGLENFVQKQICERVANAGTKFFGMLWDVYAKVGLPTQGLRPHVNRADSSVVTGTSLEYPSYQCRLDSVLSGSLGQKRPACWSNL